ncbi:hypothetical protein [Chromobacterium vaccinii]|uniref:hypothetical protein n=1 Tax=Chromobacterium vaccinii TaxID=1108595 RepID=UPI003457E1A0
MKKLLVVMLAITPLTVLAATSERGDFCKVDGSITAAANGNLLTCADGKLEYVQVVHNKLIIKELAQINQTQIKILEEVIKSKRATTTN